MRTTEVHWLDIEEVENGFPPFGFGGRHRRLPITPDLERRLQRYIEDDHPALDDDCLLLPASTQHIEQLIDTHAKTVGLAGPHSAQRVRLSVIVWLSTAGMPAAMLAHLAGLSHGHLLDILGSRCGHVFDVHINDR